jgi:type IV pilus assembly protein PilA
VEETGMTRARTVSVTRLYAPCRLPPRRRAQRGFTLVELLITVAMVGVLAALAIAGYRKYIHSAQSNEARAIIHGIRGGQEAYKAEFLVYLSPSTSLDDYYPNQAPNDARMNWNQPTDTRYSDPLQGWALLNVNADAPVRFGYACVANVGNPMAVPTKLAPAPAMPNLPNGVPWYVVQAINDHDNNGKYAVFASSSVSGEILSQDEFE